MNAISEKYKGWDITDVSNAWGEPYILDQETWRYSGGWAVYPSEEVKELRNYLSMVANGEITSENISPTAAKEQLLAQFDYIGDFHALGPLAGEPGNFDGFPMTGLDLTNKCIYYADLSNCIGLTAAQVESMGSLGNTILPTIAFTGTEDLSTTGVTLHNTDLSKCTGITSTQIANRGAWIGCKLPEVTFSGNENLQNAAFEGADLTKCSGITSEQIQSVESMANSRITSAQFTSWKDVLKSKFAGKYIYIDGVYTKL